VGCVAVPVSHRLTEPLGTTLDVTSIPTYAMKVYLPVQFPVFSGVIGRSSVSAVCEVC
jgi:hypothetical protein